MLALLAILLNSPVLAQAEPPPGHMNIASAATITADPPLDAESLVPLLDGWTKSGLAHEVGSSGDGSLTLTWDEPREVSGVRIVQSSTVYTMSALVVEGDVDGSGTFSLQLGEATDTPLFAWIDVAWETVSVRALRVRCAAGESGGLSAHPCWAEIAAIGMPLATDLEAAGKRGFPIAQIPKAHPARGEVKLIAGETMPVILAPEELSTAAGALSEGLGARLGEAPEIVSTVGAAAPGTRTVICLGNMLSNPLLTRLYFNRYTHVDSLLPGENGYVIQTVFEPYPWPRGNDVIVVGCSDAAGAAVGVDALLSGIEGEGGDSSLPYTMQIHPSRSLTNEAREQLIATKPDPSFTDFRKHAELYLKTGDEAYASRAVAALDVVVGIYEADPTRPVPWPEETTSGAIFATWDAFDECPVIDPDRRTGYVNAFLRLWRSLIPKTSGYSALGQGDSVTWNHTTFPLLGLYFGGRYLERSFGLIEPQEALAKARACFTAQAKSWKPQEDADSYLILTMAHAIDYSLAEWDLSFFESGLMEQYADYVVAICDSRGIPSGFGDSGFSSSPTLIRGALPRAFWWTKDPGYLWLLNLASAGAWENPFWRDIEPLTPDDMTGVRPFALDSQLYQYTQEKPSYNELFAPSEVSAEEAFDKVAFRESWDRDAQYLLLDGFARGKHLHYDGNSITEFIEDGERWLIDHDYLVRNTTEHNMLSVLRDGRCDSLEPSMSGLLTAADLPGIGYTKSYVPDYSGVDWTRRIMWRKGEYFIVADDVEARESGDYDLELTWKTIDLGDERLEDSRDFIASRGSAALSRHLVPVEDAQAESGRAIVLAQSTSRLTFRAQLSAGEYAVDLIAYGVDGSSDSLWMSADGGEKVAFHVPQGRYGSAGTTPITVEGTPRITLDRGGVHVFTVWLREMPPVRVERIVFAKAGAKPVTVVTTDAEPPTEQDLARADRKVFYIRPAEPVASRMTAHERKGISVPVRILHQRRHAKLSVGDESRFASLLCVTNPERPEPYDLVALGGNAYAVSGPEPAICAFGPVELDGIEIDAEACLLTATDLSAVACRRLDAAGATLTLDEPTDVSIDLATGEGAPPGSYRRDPRWRARLTRIVRSAERPGPATADAPGEADRPLWRVNLGLPGFARKVWVDDIDSDGADELLVAHDQSVSCLTADGALLWTFDTGGPTRDVSTARMADGLRVLVSSNDTYLYLLHADGTLDRKQQMTGIYFSADYGERPWGVWCSRGVDLDGDGDDEIVSGMANMELVALDEDLEEVWGYFTVAHGTTDIKIRDIDGDGKPEIIAADKYGSIHALDTSGKPLYRSHSSIGDVQFDIGPVANSDGRLGAVLGSSTGDLICTDGSEQRWRFDNFGYPVNRIVCADLDGDGTDECLIASGTGYLYALDTDGQLIWRDRLGFSVNDVMTIGSRVVYADEDGLVRAADAAGSEVRTIRTGAPARWLAQLGETACVVTGAGDVLCYGVE